MRSFFIYLFALHCAFTVCASNQRNAVVQDRSVSRSSDEDVIISSSHGSGAQLEDDRQCVFNVRVSEQCDTFVNKIHSIEKDSSVLRSLAEEARRALLLGSRSTIPVNSVDGVEDCGQYVVVKDENGNGAQLEIDKFYEECINVEFKLPE